MINVLSANSIVNIFQKLTIKEFIWKEAYQNFKKNFGIFQVFSINSQERIRNYNKDKVTIILNINQPENYNFKFKKKMPKVSFFLFFFEILIYQNKDKIKYLDIIH